MHRYLLLTRPGFEPEAAAEARTLLTARGASAESRFSRKSGWLEVSTTGGGSTKTPWLGLTSDRLVFARQGFYILDEVEGEDAADLAAKALRIAGAWKAGQREVKSFSALFVEAADGEEGRRLWPLCEAVAAEAENDPLAPALIDSRRKSRPRLHLFLATSGKAYVGVSDPATSSPWPMGIPRLRMPADSPSRSARKLEEAILLFIPANEREKRLRAGMRVVDLGAAPGGWSSLLARRGLLVTAVDNGPIDPAALETGLVTHETADGFTYRPERPAHWMVSDMVAAPERVARLVARWATAGRAREFIFNLKLPNADRFGAVERCRALLLEAAREARLLVELRLKQLYHDREEVTAHFRVVERLPAVKERKPRRPEPPTSARRSRNRKSRRD